MVYGCYFRAHLVFDVGIGPPIWALAVAFPSVEVWDTDSRSSISTRRSSLLRPSSEMPSVVWMVGPYWWWIKDSLYGLHSMHTLLLKSSYRIHVLSAYRKCLAYLMFACVVERWFWLRQTLGTYRSGFLNEPLIPIWSLRVCKQTTSCWVLFRCVVPLFYLLLGFRYMLVLLKLYSAWFGPNGTAVFIVWFWHRNTPSCPGTAVFIVWFWHRNTPSCLWWSWLEYSPKGFPAGRPHIWELPKIMGLDLDPIYDDPCSSDSQKGAPNFGKHPQREVPRRQTYFRRGLDSSAP